MGVVSKGSEAVVRGLLGWTGWSTRVLRAPHDIEAFAAGHNAAVGAVYYAPDDVAGMTVRGFCRDGEMVAGYAINSRSPSYYLNLIPLEDRQRLALLDRATALRFAEVRGLWIRRGNPNPLRALVYCLSVLDAAQHRPDFIIGGTVVERALRTQMRAVPHLLWEGTEQVWGREVHGWIFYGRPLECVLRLPYATVGGWLDRLRTRPSPRLQLGRDPARSA